MTMVLQIAFIAAGVLTWLAVVVLAYNLWSLKKGKSVRELPAHIAGQAALLFVGASLCTATVTRGFASGAVSDILLYAAVFGGAATGLSWVAEGLTLRSRPTAGRMLRRLSLAVPLGAGVLAGVVGTP